MSTDVLHRVVVGVALDMPELVPWRHALDVAAGARARLSAVMVNNSINVDALAFAGGDAALELTDRARRMWTSAVKPLELRVAEEAAQRGVKLTIVNREGSVVEQLLELSEEASLVVFGRGRQSAVDQGVLGDHTELLARRCRRALLITPVAYQRPGRVVAAYAGKPLGGRVLGLAGTLAKVLGIGLIVLTVSDDRARFQEVHGKARELLDDVETDVDYVGLLGKPHEVIPRYCSERDLLVVGPHGHSPVYRMVFGSVADRVVRAARGPVALPGRNP